MTSAIASTSGIGQITAQQQIVQTAPRVPETGKDSDGDGDASKSAVRPAQASVTGLGTLVNTHA